MSNGGENHDVRRKSPAPATPNNTPQKKKSLPKPPDGGWGWWVVAASFLIHVVADGVAYTFGLFFVKICKDLDASKGATSLIASLMAGVTYSSGPLASAFVNKYGCRPVSIAGSVVAGLGFAVSYYAESITFLCISIGVVGGLGLGLIYLPAIVSVTCYFEKRRAFATGIAVCGSGVGTFLLAPVIEWLINVQGWRSALVTTGGILFSCVIFSIFFRPLKDNSEDEEDENETLAIVDTGKDYNENGVKKPLMITEPYYHEVERAQTPQPGFGMPISAIEDSKMNNGIGDTLAMSFSQPILRATPGSDPELHHLGKRHSLKLGFSGLIGNRPHHSARHVTSCTSQQSGLILKRKDIFYSGSLLKISEIERLQQKLEGRDHEETSSTQSIKSRKICCCISCSPEFHQVFKTMMDFSILKDPVFLFFAISNFLTSIGYNVPYVYLVDMALENVKENGLSAAENVLKDGSLGVLLSIVGISNTFSRVALGYLSDKRWMNRLYLYNIALTLCGIATAASSYTADMNILRIYAACFGATVGVYVSLTSVILVDLLGLEKLTNAFGFLLLFQGTATLIGPPLVGKLYDAFDSYKFGFWLAGGAIALSGLMLFFIPFLERRKHAQEEKMDEEEANKKHLIAVKEPEDGTKFTLSSEFPSINNTQSLQLNGKFNRSEA